MDMNQKIVGSDGVYAEIAGNLHAQYGEQVPEPGTLVMLLGLAASLAVYGWKRRSSR